MAGYRHGALVGCRWLADCSAAAGSRHTVYEVGGTEERASIIAALGDSVFHGIDIGHVFEVRAKYVGMVEGLVRMLRRIFAASLCCEY